MTIGSIGAMYGVLRFAAKVLEYEFDIGGLANMRTSGVYCSYS
jgi:hypothetical protein